MNDAVFAPDFKAQPWWWEAAPPAPPDAEPLPARADVLVVGSGYTGLHAALVAARGGRDTLIVDAGALGEGCSTRNGGQISPSIKPSFDDLERRHGAQIAMAVRRSGIDALGFIAAFIESEGIDCSLARAGRFQGAHTPAHYERLARAHAAQPESLRLDAHMVPRAEQHSEIGTDFYHGGIVHPGHLTLHPALYHAGLVERARAAGVALRAGCRAQIIVRDGEGFRVQTSRGEVCARDVVVATNGYTGTVTPWQRRRVIPIGSYMIATEEIAPALADELSPTRRAMSDSRRVVFYYRLSPDGRRVLFGGRVALSETDPRISGPRLHRELVRIFPQLARTRITHSWAGFVAYTFDTLPHLGSHDGLHYAMGYCGSGVSLASWFGMCLGHKLLGNPEGRTPLDGIAFQTRPLYDGTPWFLATAVGWYKLLDRLGI
jgi:glycine/D-amino acid oxidase-like deaminating enzyme